MSLQGPNENNSRDNSNRRTDDTPPDFPPARTAATREGMILSHLAATTQFAQKAVARLVTGGWMGPHQEQYLRNSGPVAKSFAKEFQKMVPDAATAPQSVEQAWDVLQKLIGFAHQVHHIVSPEVPKWVAKTGHLDREGALSPDFLSAGVRSQFKRYLAWLDARTLATKNDAFASNHEPSNGKSVLLYRLAEFAASLGATVDQSNLPNKGRRVSALVPAAISRSVSMLIGVWQTALLAGLNSEDVPSSPPGGAPTKSEAASTIDAAFRDPLNLRVYLTASDSSLTCVIRIDVDGQLAPHLSSAAATQAPLFDAFTTAATVAGATAKSDRIVVSSPPDPAAWRSASVSFSVPLAPSTRGAKAKVRNDWTPEICEVARSFELPIPEYIQVATSVHGAQIIVAGELLLREGMGRQVRPAIDFANRHTSIKSVVIDIGSHEGLPVASINIPDPEVIPKAAETYHQRCVTLLSEGKVKETIDACAFNSKAPLSCALRDIADPEVALALRILLDATEGQLAVDVASFATFGPNGFIEFVTLLKLGLCRIQDRCGLPLDRFTLEVDQERFYREGSKTLPFRVIPRGCSRPLEGKFFRQDGKCKIWLFAIESWMTVPVEALLLYRALTFKYVEVDQKIVEPEYAELNAGNMKVGQSPALYQWLANLRAEPTKPVEDFRTALAAWMFENDHLCFEIDGVVTISKRNRTGETKGDEPGNGFDDNDGMDS